MRDRLSFFLLIGLLAAFSAGAQDLVPTNREVFTCEKEEKLFSSWSRLAGSISEEKLARKHPEARRVSVQMTDGRSVKGLHLPSRFAPAGVVLVIPGNAWRADQFVDYAKGFVDSGLDVYLFDFRGYGLSKPGIPTLSAIIEDYKEIGGWLKARNERNLYLYAFSFGGVVAMNAFPGGAPFASIVLDSVPSRPSEIGFKCQVTYDPVDKLPQSCPAITVMHGLSDWALPRPRTKELIDRVAACGGTTDVEMKRGHPFQLEWGSTSAARVVDVCHHFGVREAGQ